MHMTDGEILSQKDGCDPSSTANNRAFNNDGDRLFSLLPKMIVTT
jgi:hypothetical protein